MACSGDQMDKSFICIGNGSQSKSFFTFYSQFNRNWGGEGVLEAVVMLILAIMSVPGSLVIYVFILKSKTTRTVTNVLVCNLALADIAYCLSAPFVAYVRVHGTWTLGDGMCMVLMYWMHVCEVVMIWTLTAISIDRYVNIRKVVWTLVLIVLVFIAMWLPLFIVIALVEYDVSNHVNGMHSNALIWAVIFAYVAVA
ncbi:somatostatin-like receptor F_48D10.1 [Dreissena polymorpha]|uniref:somatostatin-like receptor F_48D10.1 n=1 Tax=Dreissena polymorpha TaxID=45954 RepID=UPI0022646344|nr:somatostatin-like receptor F_48D10.1 [Dreissena polymorpha]